MNIKLVITIIISVLLITGVTLYFLLKKTDCRDKNKSDYCKTLKTDYCEDDCNNALKTDYCEDDCNKLKTDHCDDQCQRSKTDYCNNKYFPNNGVCNSDIIASSGNPGQTDSLYKEEAFITSEKNVCLFGSTGYMQLDLENNRLIINVNGTQWTGTLKPKNVNTTIDSARCIIQSDGNFVCYDNNDYAIFDGQTRVLPGSGHSQQFKLRYNSNTEDNNSPLIVTNSDNGSNKTVNNLTKGEAI